MNSDEIEYLYYYHLPQYRTIGTRIVNHNIITELSLILGNRPAENNITV